MPMFLLQVLSFHHPPPSNSGEAGHLGPAEGPHRQHRAALPSAPRCSLGSPTHAREEDLPQQSCDGHDSSKAMKETFTGGILKCSQGI